VKKKRVVVTGLGIVSCFGNDVNGFYERLLKGESGVKTIQRFDITDYPTKFAALIDKFETEELIDKKQARRIDPFIAYTLVAGKKAVLDAQLDVERLNKERAGVLVGAGIGGLQTLSDGVDTLRDKGVRRMSPFFIPFVITNMGGALLGMEFGFMGPNYSLSTACATGNFSIINAANHIREGVADVMIAGGVEAAITPLGLGGFCACRALSERNDDPAAASRPWDKGRDGFVMGEGAGVLVLESLDHALARGAHIYAEYLGGSYSCDAYHMTEPRPDGSGVALCIQNALRDAEVTAEDVNHINAHATSTPLGDLAEIEAMKQIFKRPDKVYVNATKSLIGHTIGAAGGIEAIATVKGIELGELHPTRNMENLEESMTFHTSSKAVKMNVKVALSNSFGFGGHNATIAFSPYK